MDSYFQHSRKEILPYIPKNFESALDVGCGEGNFLELLRDMNPEASLHGVEPNKRAFEIATGKGFNIKNDYFHEALSLNANYFDIIFFNDVLEHVEDPTTLLDTAKIFAKPQHFIIASIPNVLFFENLAEIFRTKDWRYKDAGILDKTHLRFYTRKSIIRLFEESKLEILSVQGINPLREMAPKYKRSFKLMKLMFPAFFKETEFLQYLIVSKTK